ncbi:hypothetical protein MTBPR1_110006 [Candidatus Terasakiella magnetica]|uniref:Chemoreceptor zinc-binding domain-containing protein n=1 Tax=Candidatus Terasakiella magnetica TaxID=1867952 RepID=A0A1C3RE47_9PROT|nr:CZB domain-containing protein [Candidatus Terasakiella magnetica]SCA55567.1 hypothetical protein MTBPR1_110006 [Candidatus Terasakiella magnetica]
MSQVAEMSSRNKDKVDEVFSAVDKSNTLINNRVEDWAKVESDRALVEVARLDHIKFRKHVTDAALGRVSVKPEELSTHTNCRLGKWYYSIQSEVVKNMKVYRDLEAPHARVHDHGKAVLQAVANHDHDQAMRELDILNHAAHDVLDLLEELSDEMLAQGIV